jgi:hypothetical protein
MVCTGVLQALHIVAAYDDRFIYWAEKRNDNAGIYKSALDGVAYNTVVSLGIEVVENLDADWVGRSIYFADSGRKIIAGCDLHGATCTGIVSDGLAKPRGFVVNPQSRLFFWTDWGSHPHIGSAGMGRKDIITTEIVPTAWRLMISRTESAGVMPNLTGWRVVNDVSHRRPSACP